MNDSEIESRYDEQYQRHYYFNRRTSATGWSVEDVKQASSPAVHKSRTPTRRSSVKAVIDKSTGQEYFYNEDTGQTGWTPDEVEPGFATLTPTTPAGRMDPNADYPSYSSSSTPREGTTGEIEERWAESKGQYYFVHKPTGKTAWSREELLQDVASRSHAPQLQLDANIKSKKSSDGRLYYYNAKTGKSGWRPEDVVDRTVRPSASELSTHEETEYAMKQAETEMQQAMEKARESAQLARLRADKEMERAMKLAEHNAEVARKRAEERSLMELRRVSFVTSVVKRQPQALF